MILKVVGVPLLGLGAFNAIWVGERGMKLLIGSGAFKVSTGERGGGVTTHRTTGV